MRLRFEAAAFGTRLSIFSCMRGLPQHSQTCTICSTKELLPLPKHTCNSVTVVKKLKVFFFALAETFPLERERGTVARRQFFHTRTRRAGQVQRRGGVCLQCQIIWCRRSGAAQRSCCKTEIFLTKGTLLVFFLSSSPSQLWLVPLLDCWWSRKQDFG